MYMYKVQLKRLSNFAFSKRFFSLNVEVLAFKVDIYRKDQLCTSKQIYFI